jgi:predicted permease
MRYLLAELRHAWRSLVRDPGPSATVVLVLGLGIAATVSVYSITAGVVLRPLPYPEPEDLVQIRQVDPAEGYEYGTSGPTYRDWRGAATSLESLAVASGGQVILDGAGDPIRVGSASVSADFFRVLRVPPVLGRALVESDAEPGSAKVAVISRELWQRRFGGSPDVLGRVIRLQGEPHEVVGVVDGLDLPPDTEIWVPIPADAGFMEVRGAHILTTVARLADGVTPAMAESELNAIVERVPDESYQARVVPLKDQLVGDFRTPMLVLLGAVTFVLLVAAANAGTLLLARSARRRRELAIRGALGAGSARLALQLLAESAILAVVAGAAGVLVSAWVLDGLVALAPADLPRAGEVGLDAGVLGFAVVVSLATGLLAGLVPTLQAARTAPAVRLKEGDTRAGGRGGRAQRAFVVAEVALSVVLLIGAGLLGRSFYAIVSTDPGFDAERVTTFGFALPGFRYQEEWQVRRYHDALLQGVRALPQVSSASIAQNLPVGGSYMVTPALVEGREIEDPPRVQISAVSPGFFETMGLERVSGRSFTADDDADAPPIAMVDEAFARVYFDGENPVGKRARTYFGEPVMREIVGVVRSTVHASLTDAREPRFYYPAAQLPPASGRLVVRSDAPPGALIPPVRSVIRSVDPEVPPTDVATMSQLLARTTAEPRFYAMTLTVFAGLALVLAVAGFFAVLSQAVTTRQREIGIRIAIGGDPGGVLRMVVSQGLRLTALGAAIGAVGALAGARLLHGLLYQVEPADPSVFALVIMLVLLVALAAAWVPARRAAAVDPMEALRTE